MDFSKMKKTTIELDNSSDEKIFEALKAVYKKLVDIFGVEAVVGFSASVFAEGVAAFNSEDSEAVMEKFYQKVAEERIRRIENKDRDTRAADTPEEAAVQHKDGQSGGLASKAENGNEANN